VAPRLEPLSLDECDELVRSLTTRSTSGEERALNIFTTLDRHPDLFRRWLALGGALLDGKLTARTRELVILRTAHLIDSNYEWSQHVPAAAAAGVDAAEIESLRDPLNVHSWLEADRVALEAADELHETFALSDETWETLSRHFDAPRLIELLMLVGFYHLVGLMISGLRIEIEAP